MNPHHSAAAPHPAVVARNPIAGDAEQYLTLSPQGAPSWTCDLKAATPFTSMREATRMALRLASADRAFGLPLRSATTAALH